MVVAQSRAGSGMMWIKSPDCKLVVMMAEDQEDELMKKKMGRWISFAAEEKEKEKGRRRVTTISVWNDGDGNEIGKKEAGEE